MKKILILGMSLFLTMSNANAYEVKNVCAKYMTNYSWSKAYQVQTQVYTGQELNQATGNPYFGNYDMFSHYAVVWWDNGQASIIKINDIYVAGGILFNTNGIDLFKKLWYFLTFKTYENNLLTSGGANYLSVIAVIVSDATARQKRLQNEQNKLAELQQLAQEQ